MVLLTLPQDDGITNSWLSPKIIFILSGGTGSDKFFIGDLAGLYLRKSLDYEVTRVHNLTVVVTDQGLLPQKQATSTVMVTVEDVNDNPPVSAHAFFFLFFFVGKISNNIFVRWNVKIECFPLTHIHWLLIEIKMIVLKLIFFFKEIALDKIIFLNYCKAWDIHFITL